MTTIIMSSIAISAMVAGFLLGAIIGGIRANDAYWEGYRKGRRDAE